MAEKGEAPAGEVGEGSEDADCCGEACCGAESTDQD